MKISEDYNKDSVDYNWQIVVKYAIQKADFVEFNVNYPDDYEKIKMFLNTFRDTPAEIIKSKKKYFGENNYVLRMKLTPELKNYLLTTNYTAYLNTYMEDPSFYVGEKEFVVSITHENMIVLLDIEPHELDILVSEGFEIS